MTHSTACTLLVSQFEGLSTVAYQDGNGVLTCGYGHTTGVEEGTICTPAEALQWLSEDMDVADAAVNRLVKVLLTQNQFDALVSFCFNVGQGNLATSTLLSLLNQGAYAGASAQFLVWDKIAGVPSAGLQRRRQAEQHLFNEEAS